MAASLAALFSRQMSIGSSSSKLVCRLSVTPSTSLRQSVRTMKTVRSPTGATWGGGKQKTHTGTGKRFAPISKAAGTHLGTVLPRDPASRQAFGAMVLEGALPNDFLSTQSVAGMTFKRGHTGMRHLNSKMSSKRRRKLRGTTVVTHPSHIKALRRLLGKRASK